MSPERYALNRVYCMLRDIKADSHAERIAMADACIGLATLDGLLQRRERKARFRVLPGRDHLFLPKAPTWIRPGCAPRIYALKANETLPTWGGL
jgi:hypothetical protein